MTACLIHFVRADAVDAVGNLSRGQVGRVIAEDAKYYARKLAVDNQHLVHYMDSLAAQIGCRPFAHSILKSLDLRLLWHCFMGSQNGFQYRLFGPHADYERSREIIVELPIATSKIHLPVYLAVTAVRGMATMVQRGYGGNRP